ncbi:MAG TPA: hypothetical protein VE981_14680 [Planctomycetota bacterium]|nr:hypothetical protein [Planctomycetota bacterium]
MTAIHLRQPTDTRKGQMWRDVGLKDWLFEIDAASGDDIGRRLLAIFTDADAAASAVAKARAFTAERGKSMMAALGAHL